MIKGQSVYVMIKGQSVYVMIKGQSVYVMIKRQSAYVMIKGLANIHFIISSSHNDQTEECQVGVACCTKFVNNIIVLTAFTVQSYFI